MRGELGPLAQAVAKYQMERKLQRELEKLKNTEEKLNAVIKPGSQDKKVHLVHVRLDLGNRNASFRLRPANG